MPSSATSLFALFVEPRTLQVLLVLQESGKWALPGGHRSPGEANAAALIREVMEEISIDVSRFTPQAAFSVARKQGAALVHVYFRRPLALVRNEIRCARWVNPLNPPSRTSKTARMALEAHCAARGMLAAA